jgi:sugar lactone lactonase YvrE
MKKKIFTLSLIALGFSVAQSQTINTIAGNGSAGFSGDGGQATAADLDFPYGLVVDGTGNLYISEYLNYDVREINTSGVISQFAGNHTSGFSGDGGQATAAELGSAGGVNVDGSGNIYIADGGNNRIRMVNPSGIISTIAGNGTAGFAGDNGQATAAELSIPFDVVKDASGNIYIADYSNNRIRKINTAGIITTIAGNGTGSYSGDGGQATAAEIADPPGIVLDPAGNLYIADYLNNRIRKVATSGIITTIAGNGTAGYSGDGGQATAAEINNPVKLAMDNGGSIYLTEFVGHRVRRISTSGVITTLTGTNVAGFSGDGGPATAAEISSPVGVTLDASGNLYLGDNGNQRVRKITGIPLDVNATVNRNEFSVYPNPTSDNLTVTLTNAGKIVVTLYDITGREMLNMVKENTSAFNISVAGMPSGIYLLKLQTEDGSILTKKIEVAR